MGSNVTSDTVLSGAQREIYHRFSRLSLPRHTSYPTVPHWKESVDSFGFDERLRQLADRREPVGFYLHVPFCEKACAYCGCNKLIVAQNHPDADSIAERYLNSLEKEMHRITQGRDGTLWQVEQLHWGGGTPTWLNLNHLERVFNILTRSISLTSSAEISIEVDPRITTYDQLRLLRELGFNRISLGVQDFDEVVQRAIQRAQPFELVRDTVEQCRNLGFHSINFDLIYGLPKQTRASVKKTLEQVVDLRPDRIAFYRFALLPNIFKLQRAFREEDIPDDESILDFMLTAINYFGSSGWRFIGLDHFAKEGDELSKSLQSGTLRRSFQGVSTGSDIPVVAVGPSAISDLGDCFFQNESQFSSWANKVRVNESALTKYYMMSLEDQRRRWVINQLYCYRSIDKFRFKSIFGLDFESHFADLKPAWQELEQLGILAVSEQALTAKPLLGWLLLRVIAATFDEYIPRDAWKKGLGDKVASRVG